MDSHSKPRPPKRSSYLFTAIIGAIIGGMIVGIFSMYYMNARLDSFIGDQVDQADQSGQKQIILADETKVGIPQAVAEKVNPSVVGIQTIEVSLDVFLRPVQQGGVGTGVIVSEDGIILTNHHVISDNPKEIIVRLKDGRELKAERLWSNAHMDLAVIKIDASGLPVADLGDSDNLSIGQPAIAIGNPLGLRFERTVTSGIVSALNRSLMVSENNIAEDLIQTDASINSGNSGGPLLNSVGQVIGINTYKSQQGEGMGFAIPINVAKPIINQILEHGQFRPTVLGVSGLDREMASYISPDYEIDRGVVLIDIDPKGGAHDAGLREGDVITHINGKEINTMLQLRTELYKNLPGEQVTMTYLRENQEQKVEVILQEGNE